MIGALIGVLAFLLVVICVAIGTGLWLKQSGKPRMTRFERRAVDRRVSNHLQQLAEEAAFQKVVAAMGYEVQDE